MKTQKMPALQAINTVVIPCHLWSFWCLVIVFLTILISNLVSTLPSLFWPFGTFMDKVLSTGKQCHSFWKMRTILYYCYNRQLNSSGVLWVQRSLTYQREDKLFLTHEILNQNQFWIFMAVFCTSLLPKVDLFIQKLVNWNAPKFNSSMLVNF